MRDDLPVLVTGPEAAILAHVEPSTVRSWVRRDKIQPAAQTSAGYLLFALPDVFAMAAADRPDSTSA